MTRAAWSISLPLVLMLVAPPANATSSDNASSQITPLRLAPLRVAPLRVAPLQVSPLRLGQTRDALPPGIPPGSGPFREAASAATVAGSTPPRLQDASRDYRGELPAFPGAEGFGSTTPAGRGGRILRVTSLEDSGPGTLREAVNTPGPRTVIFEVGGIIRLKKRIEVFEPFLTIAGQTAPSPGITLVGDALKFNTHDVLLQHLRIRVGDEVTSTNTRLGERDGIGVRTNPEGSRHTYNILIAHCSISWATDENVSFWYPNVYDVTIQDSIISEALPYRTEPVYSRGMIVGHGQRRIAGLRNLFAHNGNRNPVFGSDSTGLLVNNVIYNSGNAVIVMADNGDGPILLTVVGNVYLPGLDSRRQRNLVRVNNKDGRTRLFVDDNIGPYSTDDPWTDVDNRVGEHIRANGAPVSVLPLGILDSAKTLGRVLAGAGARPADRDAVDLRIVRDVRTGGGRLIRTPADVGGLPAVRPARRTLILPRTPSRDTNGDGYTDLEEWLHCMARKVEGRATPTDACLGPDEHFGALAGY